MTAWAPPEPERPWLVADIGGTNARFGLVTAPGGPPDVVRSLPCASYPGLAGAVTAYLEGVESPTPSAACMAVAGPVSAGGVRLTNGPWDISVATTRDQLGLDRFTLINDFVALAMSLPWLEAADLRHIGGPDVVPGRPMAVLGPGTGLGVAGVLPVGGRWVPVDSEGGHTDAPAVTDREIEVARLLRAGRESVSAEYLLSGSGLERLHGALRQVHGLPAQPAELPRPVDAATICAAGVAGTDKACVEALSVFCALLGGFAGNVALTLGARGGVFLGGGMLPRIADFLETSDFRRRFEAKQEMASYVEAVGTTLIVTPTPALRGAAAWLEQYGE